MKIKLHLKLLIFGALISSGLFSQKVDYERDTKWNIGFNMGATWQDSDIKLRTPGFGYGFTFGRSIYERPNSFFGVDLRFRYLRGTTYGMDPNRLTLDSNDTFYNQPEHNYVDSLGYTYLNNSTDLHDYSLEMVINFHKLREQTGILLHVFGGIGITDYQSKTNLLDKNGNLYNYSGLDTSGTMVSQAQLDLMDGDYESNAYTHNGRQIKVMPSLGFGIGYQVGPSFSIGLEHRTTFTLNDVFEGYAAPGSEFVNLKSGNDLYHYTGINFRWNILKGKYKEPAPVTTTTPVTNYDPCDKPTVRIINPTQNEAFETKYISVSSKVTGVKSNNDVIVKVNSKSVQTQYSASTELVTANVTLANGNNKIEVIATNSCGSTVKTVNVKYEEKLCLKPVIQISAPAQTVNNATQILAAKVLHLNGGTLSVSLNGRTIAHNYNTSTQDLSANLKLVKGNNTIIVRGSNSCGDTMVSYNVVFNEVPCLNPTVVILAPSNGTKSQYQAVTLSARIINQTDRNFISVKLNGNDIPFTFSSSNQLVTASLTLLEGNNTVEVKATNECGVDVKTISVSYEKAPCLAPVVSIVSPQNGQAFNQANISFNASVQNITSANQVQVKLNGNVVASSFNASNNTVNANVSLANGSNILTITATNNCGSVSKEVMVSYACEKPNVSIISPANGLVVTNGSVQLSGTAINLTNQNQLSVKLNGRAVAFSYNSQTSSFSGMLNLVNGVNVINVSATNNCGTDNDEVRVTYNEPCLKPVITVTSPVANQNFTTANITISGYIANVTNQSQVTIEQDGAPVSFNFNGGNISANTTISKGNNTITITATNNCGTTTVTIPVTYDAPCPKPTVLIVSPQNAQTFNTKTVSFVANVSNIVNSSQAIISLNGTIVSGIYNGANKTVTTTLNLIEGNNTIKVVAQNECGSDEAVINVTYKCNAPKINFINKMGAQNVVSTATTTISASVTNVTSANQIVVKINGNVVQHNFDVTTGILTISTTLSEGKNTIDVVATNNCGNDAQNLVINYTAPCVAPVVSIASPMNGQVFTTPSLALSGSVLNIAAQNQLSLKLNGNAVAVTYNSTNKTYSANLTLADGSNSIVVSATNNCGSDSKTITVTYNKPCDKPVVNFSKPINNDVVTNRTISVEAFVQNVSSQSQLIFRLNGISESFVFDANTGKITATLNLQAGENRIFLNASTDCGKDGITIKVNYNQPCDKPDVRISSPADGKVVKNPNIELTGLAYNVTSQSQLVVLLNGVSKNFSFNASSKTYNASLTLKEGVNTIEVKATTECGVSSKVIKVTYEACKAPTVTINSPASNGTVTQEQVSYSATVGNVTDRNNITVEFNGAPATFNYDATTGALTGVVNAVDGSNSIVITVTKECGTARAEVVFTKEKCDKPVIIPGAELDGTTVTDPNLNLDGYAQNIGSSAQMTIVVNGQGKTYAYDFKSEIYRLSLVLVEGANTIVLTATNNCGTATKTITIYYKPCYAPTISLSKPKDRSTIYVKTAKLVATVNNVTNKSQVSLKLNGSSFPFTLSGTTLSANLTGLVAGGNNILIEVQTDCGRAAKEAFITVQEIKPVIKLKAPTTDTVNTNEKSISIEGIIDGIYRTSDVVITVNGNAITPTTIKSVGGTKFQLLTNVTLVNGKNVIVVKATNKYSFTDSKTIVVNSNQPVQNNENTVAPAPRKTITKPVSRPASGIRK